MKYGGICILSKNVLKLAEFYKCVFQVDTQGDENHCSILIEGTGLVIWNNGEVKDIINDNIEMQFSVDNVDEQYERLVEMDVSFIQLPTTHPWGWRTVVFRDPDGNHIRFACQI